MSRNDTRTLAEAAAWVEWASQPNPSPERAPDFDRWMADPAHREQFADLLALWRSDALAEAARVVQARAQRRKAPAWIGWTAGASTLAAAALALVTAPLLENTAFETPRGGGQAVVLADGSQVRLSGDARIEVAQGLTFRRVRLARGEAYFDVRHDARRPFRVDAGPAQVRVLGTAFDLDRHSAGQVDLAVYRGAVRLQTPGGASTRLVRGERAAVVAGEIVPVAQPVGAEPDWLAGWADASDAPLGQLLEEIGRFADRPVVAADGVDQRRISGRFHVADTQSALAALSLAYGVSVTVEPHRYLIGHSPRAPQ